METGRQVHVRKRISRISDTGSASSNLKYNLLLAAEYKRRKFYGCSFLKEYYTVGFEVRIF